MGFVVRLLGISRVGLEWLDSNGVACRLSGRGCRVVHLDLRAHRPPSRRSGLGADFGGRLNLSMDGSDIAAVFVKVWTAFILVTIEN
jgi:hypothetical protein